MKRQKTVANKTNAIYKNIIQNFPIRIWDSQMIEKHIHGRKSKGNEKAQKQSTEGVTNEVRYRDFLSDDSQRNSSQLLLDVCEEVVS